MTKRRYIVAAMAAIMMGCTIAPAIAAYGIPPKYQGEWCVVHENPKWDSQYALCRNVTNPFKKMTITADTAGPCKIIGHKPYYEGPADPTAKRDTESWIIHIKCPNDERVVKIWRTDNNGPLTTTREPGLMTRDITNTTMGRAIKNAPKNPYAEPPP